MPTVIAKPTLRVPIIEPDFGRPKLGLYKRVTLPASTVDPTTYAHLLRWQGELNLSRGLLIDRLAALYAKSEEKTKQAAAVSTPPAARPLNPAAQRAPAKASVKSKS